MKSSNALSEDYRNQEQLTRNNIKINSNIQKFVRHIFGHTGKYQVMTTRGDCDTYGNKYNHGELSQASANSYQDPNRGRRPSGYNLPTTSNSSASSQQQDSTNQLSNSDQLTLDLVDQFKRNIQEKIKSGEFTNKEKFIEIEVSKIRRTQNPQLTDKVWKRNLPSGIDGCHDSILHAAMAYGDDPKEVEIVLKAKIQKFDPNENEDPATTSLKKIFDPLNRINGDLVYPSPSDLWHAVREINDNQIDRADRMFYGEARRRLKNKSENYTFDIAHDQVQAIRLMHYELDNEEDLLNLIENYRTFDTAYSYLLRLARKRVKESEPNTSIQNNKPNRKSVIITAPGYENNDAYDNNSRLNNSARPSNNYSPPEFSPDRPPYQHQNSRYEDSRDRNKYSDSR